MTQSGNSTPARPKLFLRVGITGARSLRKDQLERLQAEMREVLVLVAEKMKSHAALEWVGKFYAGVGGSVPEFDLQMISPLAKGADRLAARVALDAGYELYVPMPFSKDEYHRDFTGSSPEQPDEEPMTAEEDRGQFDDLFLKAKGSFALDGGHDPKGSDGTDYLAARSYEYVGRFVVRHSDLLIAIWNGEPSRGRGGTAEVVHFAANAGVPVWCIPALEDVPPVWIADMQDLRDFEDRTAQVTAPDEQLRELLRERLKAYLEKLIVPPKPVGRHQHHNWIARTIYRFREKEVTRAAEYLQERPLPRWFVWNSYKGVMRFASGVKPEFVSPRQPEEPVDTYWFEQFTTADALASQFAPRYRSSYVLVILLTMFGLIFGGFAVYFAVTSAAAQGSQLRYWGVGMALAELLTLAAVMVVVGLSFLRDWHERSIEYRLLAELFRKQQTLASLGWSLSIGNVQQQLADTERLSWIAWLFAAMKRAAPLPQGGLTSEPSRIVGKKALDDLIHEQLVYHTGREKVGHKAGIFFERLGGAAFAILLLCVLVKVGFELLQNIAGKGVGENLDTLTLFLGLSGLVLPGVSAAFVGIRSYAELQLLAEQSRHMIGELTRSSKRVDRLNLKRPLASQDLGAEAVTVATLMLQDLEGWGRLFRGKSPEQ